MKIPKQFALFASFVISLPVVHALFPLAYYRPFNNSLLKLVQYFILWIPVFALFNIKWVVTQWKKSLVAAVTAVIALAVLGVLYEESLEKKGIPLTPFNLSVDHRTKPFENGANADGFLSDPTSDKVNEQEFNIIFLGDSFTMGLNVSTGDRFPSLIEKKCRESIPEKLVKAINFAWVSSGPILQLRQLKDIGARFKPDLIVQAIDMTDFRDDVEAYQAFKDLDEEAASKISKPRRVILEAARQLWMRDHLLWPKKRITENPKSVGFLEMRSLKRYFPLWMPLEKSRPFLDITWQTLLETNELAQKMGARYAVFIIPRYQLYDPAQAPEDKDKNMIPTNGEYLYEPFKYFREKAAEAPFPIHSLLDDFKNTNVRPTVFKNDFHWNADGHRVAADAVFRDLRNDGLL